jgi:TolB protein
MRLVQGLIILWIATLLAGCGAGRAENVSCKRVLFSAGHDIFKDIYSICPDGSGLKILIPGADMPSWSPDGTRIVFVAVKAGQSDVFTADSDGSNIVQVTNDALADSLPAWLADGRRIALRSTDGTGLWWWRIVNLDDGESADISEHLYDWFFQTPAWSPDGAWTAYMSLVEQQERNDGSSQIHVRSADGRSDIALTHDIWANINPAWSPNGKRIAFLSEMDGEYNKYSLYVIDTNGEDLRRLLDNNNDLDENTRLAWSPDGWSMAYNTALMRIDVIDLLTGKVFELVNPIVAFGKERPVGYPAWQP